MSTLIDITGQHATTANLEAALEVRMPGGEPLGFICIHDSRRGPGVGGIRRRRYASAADAVADAASLARQMTWKTRFADLPCGGAKAVILDRPGLDVPAAYRAFGDAVAQLGGRYFCGPDVGTGEEHLGWLRERTDYVNSANNDASEATARGVLAGIRACLRHAGLDAGLRVVVQGVGRVGMRVAEALAPRTASLSVADPSDEACATFPSAARLPHSPSDAVVTHAADLLSPCAVGPVITARNVEHLRCRVVCGSANTQLETGALAATMASRGVIYAPDFVVNAGAVIEGVLAIGNDTDVARSGAAERIDAIEGRLLELLKTAERGSFSPLRLAMNRVGEAVDFA